MTLVRGGQSSWLVGRRSLLRFVIVLAFVGLALPVIAATTTSPAAAAPVAPFTPVFHTQDNGAIGLFGNTVETCPLSASTCLAARNGTATGGDLNNNNYTMGFINIDPGAGIVDSSSADVTLLSGSVVLFAGLYWGADSSPEPEAPTPRCR